MSPSMAPQIKTAAQVAQMQMAAAASGQVFDINSVMAGWVDRGAWKYYDRIIQPLSGTGANGAALYNRYTPFSVPINSPDQITQIVKDKSWTNMENSKQFAAPRCLVLKRIGFYFEPDMLLADIEMFMKNAYFEFKIDGKIFFEGLLEFFPSGLGISGYSTITGDGVWQNGGINPHATIDFGNYAKYIAPMQNFFLTITLPNLMPVTNKIGGTTPGTNPGGAPTLTAAAAGGTGLNLVCVLDGLTDRSVQ